MPGLTLEARAPVAAEARARSAWWLLAVGLGIAGALATVGVLVVTRDSPGFFPDSSVYLGTARNLLDGRGLTTPFNLQFNPYPPAQAVAFHGKFPLTVYPPLYPVVLAAMGSLGAGLIDGARVVNALLLGVNVVLGGILIWRITRSTLVAVLTAFGLAVTVNVVVNHALVMSEPLMIAIVLGGTLLTPWMLRTGGTAAVVTVGAFAAAATLARVAGVAFAAAVVVAALLWLARPLRERVTRAALLAAVGLGPSVLWVLVTRAVSDAVDVRPLRLHLPTGDVYDTFVDTVSDWLVGSGGDRAAHVVLLVLLVVAVTGLAWFVATDRLPPGATAEAEAQRGDSNHLLGVLALFVAGYVAVLYLTAALFDAGLSIEGRLLVPVQVVGALLVVGLTYRAAARVRGASVAAVAAVVVIALGAWPWREIAQGYGTVSTVELLDRGFRAPSPSALGRAVRALPSGALVASTYPSTLYSTSGRDVVFVPPRWDRMSGDDNEQFHDDLVELGRLLSERRGYLALYPGPAEEFATVAELARVMQMVPVGRFADGTLYRVEGLQPGVR